MILGPIGPFAFVNAAVCWRWLLAVRFGLYLLAILSTSGAAFGDYTQHRKTYNIANQSSETVQKRVTMYAAIETPGTTTYNWTPTVGVSGESPSTHYVQFKVLIDNAVVHTSAMIPNPNGLGSSWSGVPAYMGPTQTRSTPFPSGSRSMQKRIWSTALGGAWGSYNFLSEGSIGSVTTSTTGSTFARGELLHQWMFEMKPHSATVLNLQHSTPFFVVVENLKQRLTPDGGTAYEWEEEDEDTSASVTVTDPATTPPDPVQDVPIPEADYSTGPEIAPVPRKATVASFQDLNDNDESRTQDVLAALEKINTGIEDTVKGIGGLQGGTPKESEADTAEAAAVEAHKQGIFDAMVELYDATNEFLDETTRLYQDLQPPPSAAPSFYLSFTIPWHANQTLVLSSNPTMDYWMAVARQIMLVSIGFIGFIGILHITRSAFV